MKVPAIGSAPERDLTNEQLLWNEVIARAINDFAHWFTTNHTDRRLSRSARAWLFGGLHVTDFRMVCEMAGIEPDVVRRIAHTLWLTKVPEDLKIMQNALWKEVTTC